MLTAILLIMLIYVITVMIDTVIFWFVADTIAFEIDIDKILTIVIICNALSFIPFAGHLLCTAAFFGLIMYFKKIDNYYHIIGLVVGINVANVVIGQIISRIFGGIL